MRTICSRLSKLETYMPKELPLPILLRKRKGKYYDSYGREVQYPRENMREHPIILDYDQHPEYDPEREQV